MRLRLCFVTCPIRQLRICKPRLRLVLMDQNLSYIRISELIKTAKHESAPPQSKCDHALAFIEHTTLAGFQRYCIADCFFDDPTWSPPKDIIAPKLMSGTY